MKVPASSPARTHEVLDLGFRAGVAYHTLQGSRAVSEYLRLIAADRGLVGASRKALRIGFNCGYRSAANGTVRGLSIGSPVLTPPGTGCMTTSRGTDEAWTFRR